MMETCSTEDLIFDENISYFAILSFQYIRFISYSKKSWYIDLTSENIKHVNRSQESKKFFYLTNSNQQKIRFSIFGFSTLFCFCFITIAPHFCSLCVFLLDTAVVFKIHYQEDAKCLISIPDFFFYIWGELKMIGNPYYWTL